MREFMSLNADAFRADSQANGKVPFNSYKDKMINPMPFIMARGSLIAPTYTLDDGNHIAIKSLDGFDTFDTAEEIYSALGVQTGDLITFCYVHGTPHVENKVYSYEPDGFYIVRLNCDKTGAVSKALDAFTIEANRADAVVNINVAASVLTIASGLADFGCVILSRKASDKWLRSNATMIVNSNVLNNVKVNNQLVTYPVGEDLILNNGPMKANSNNSTAKAIPLLSLSATTIAVTKGNTAKVPTLSGAPSDAAITYDYNSNYLTIESSTGVITPKRNGSPVVTIRTAATDEYAASSIKFTVNISGFDSSSSDSGDESE